MNYVWRVVKGRMAAVQRVLAHLGLPTTAPGLRAPPDQPAGRVADPPRERSYGPFRADLPIPAPAIVWPEGAGAGSVPRGLPFPQDAHGSRLTRSLRWW